MLLKTTDDKTEIVLARWQTCVEMANSVSQRRDTMNNIFVTLNLAIVAEVDLQKTDRVIIAAKQIGRII